MGLVAAAAASLVLWVALWGLGIKAFDGMWIVFGVLIVAAIGHILARYLPGRS